jgi:ubiquinone/menaquinone biosynthesis C-methylase UbiE
MSFFDRLYAIGPFRKFLWRRWYSFLTLQLRRDDVQFLNYAYEEEPPMQLPLTEEEEKNRGCIQLYHHVASQAELRNKEVLEVSCGHGGGAAYLTRTFAPARYVGLDLNPRGIRFCRKKHRVEGLSFVVGDAENLPFPDNSFDVVINIEASHCYASLPRFLKEVARVLRPSGRFVYADFRFASEVANWEKTLLEGSFQTLQHRDISAEVQRGMAMNSSSSQSLIERRLPKGLQKLGGDFAGVKGSRIYNAVSEGQLTYRSFCFAPLKGGSASSEPVKASSSSTLRQS